MVDKIEVVNTVTKDRIILTKEPGNPFILDTDGISWGQVEATHNTYTNLTGVGNILASTKLGERTISIVGKVCSPYTRKQIAELYNLVTYEDIDKKRIEQIEESKSIVSQLINPLHDIRIESSDYFITGRPNSSVVFSNTWNENNEVFCKFTVSFTCNDPLFHYRESSSIPLSGLFGGFHFPLAIKSPRGMHYGIRQPYQLINVSNTGDVALGGIITIKATGTVKNPSLTNVKTQEILRINKILQFGEVVRIDTTNRIVEGSPDGEEFENYISYWDFDNTWFEFEIGDTLFGYSADDETYKNMEMSIALNKSFYSMEDQ